MEGLTDQYFDKSGAILKYILKKGLS